MASKTGTIAGVNRARDGSTSGLMTPGNEVLMCAQPITCVYFVQSGHGGPVKIGIATDVKKRLSSMQTSNPVSLVLMAAVPGGLDLERELHARFNIGCIRNEWFKRDTPGLIETVEHILRHGELPTLPEPDPVGWICDGCGWPMEDELSEHGLLECWQCIQDRLKAEDKRSARGALAKTQDLQAKHAA